MLIKKMFYRLYFSFPKLSEVSSKFLQNFPKHCKNYTIDLLVSTSTLIFVVISLIFRRKRFCGETYFGTSKNPKFQKITPQFAALICIGFKSTLFCFWAYPKTRNICSCENGVYV